MRIHVFRSEYRKGRERYAATGVAGRILKRDLRETECEGVAYNHVPLDSIQRRGFVNKEFAS
jgi:hypothetical protein